MTIRSLMTGLVILSLAIPALAQRPGGFPGRGPGGPAGGPPAAGQAAQVDPVAEVQKALNLTDAQASSLRTLLDNNRTQMQSIGQDMQQKRQALQALLSAGSTNATEIGNAFLAVQAAERRAEALRTSFKASFNGLLTSSQQQLLKDIAAAAEKIRPLAAIGVIDRGDGPPQGRPMGMGPRGPGF